MSSDILYTKVVERAGMWSSVVSRGKTLRLTDLEGGANAGILLYNADLPTERYNMPDTLKGQHIFYLTSPYCLHSDMGRVFCSITEDTMGWHDTVCGCSSAQTVKNKYGENDYQTAGNRFYRNSRANFMTELGKWGLGKRDIVPNMNLFSKVVSDAEGKLGYVSNASKAGDSISLRFEMNTLVVLSACQHPLDPKLEYAPKPIKLEVFKSEAPNDEDPCRLSRPENERAFLNTEDYYALRG